VQVEAALHNGREVLCCGKATVLPEREKQATGTTSKRLNVERFERRNVEPNSELISHKHPHPGWFFAKSAEAIEKKRVEFFVSAKECAMV
jgi:hypothetical protein